MIERETVTRIMDAAQIVEVISDFVTLKKKGVNYIGLCPFHEEKTGSFIVSPTKSIFKCFGCGAGGNVVNFIMKHEQLDYPGALRYLAKRYNIEIEEKAMDPLEKMRHSQREKFFSINDFALHFFKNLLHKTDEGKTIGLSYFRERGFIDPIIEKFQLGYASSRSGSFAQAALKAGYKIEDLEAVGLSHRNTNRPGFYDRFQGRVIFPIFSISGKVVGFGGRVLQKSDKMAKYLNSPESLIYSKREQLYGLYQAKNSVVKHDRVFLVEGYTDVISMVQSGIENVVASSGTSLTKGQIKLIRRFTNNVTILYDGDSAGIKASLRGIDLFLEEGVKLKVLLLPDGEDPDSFARSHNASDFVDYIDQHQVDFIRFKSNLLLKGVEDDPYKKNEAIQSILKSISLIEQEDQRSLFVRECATLMDLPETTMVHEINKYIRAQKEENLKQWKRDKAMKARKTTTFNRQNSNHLTQDTPQNTPQGPPPNTPYDMPQESFTSRPGMPPSRPSSTPNGPPDYVPSDAPFSSEPPSEEDRDYGQDPWETSLDGTPPENFPQTYPQEAPSSSPVGTGSGSAPASKASSVGAPSGQSSSSYGQQEQDQSGYLSGNMLVRIPFFKEERSVLFYLVRYGHDMVSYAEEDEEGTKYQVHETVLDFLREELESLPGSDKVFHNALHNQLFEEALEHSEDTAFCIDQYFLRHPDLAMQQLTSELLTDPDFKVQFKIEPTDLGPRPTLERAKKEYEERYVESYSRLLYRQLNTTVLEYKLAIVQHELVRLRKKVSLFSRNASSDEDSRTSIKALMQKFAQYTKIRNEIAGLLNIIVPGT